MAFKILKKAKDLARARAAKAAAKEAREKKAKAAEARAKQAAKPPKSTKTDKPVNPKVEADKKAKDRLTKQRVKNPAEKQSARKDSDSPMIQKLQKEADIRTGGNKPPAFFSDGPTKAEKGAAAYRTTSDYTRQQLKEQQANYERLYTKLQNPDLSDLEKAGLRKSMLNVEKQIGRENLDMGFKANVKPPKPKTKAKESAKPVVKSLRGAFNKAKAEGKKTFKYDGKTMNTEAVAKRFAAAEKKAGLARGGMPTKRMGSTDYRKGGMVLSTVNNKRGR